MNLLRISMALLLVFFFIQCKNNQSNSSAKRVASENDYIEQLQPEPDSIKRLAIKLKSQINKNYRAIDFKDSSNWELISNLFAKEILESFQDDNNKRHQLIECKLLFLKGRSAIENMKLEKEQHLDMMQHNFDTYMANLQEILGKEKFEKWKNEDDKKYNLFIKTCNQWNELKKQSYNE